MKPNPMVVDISHHNVVGGSGPALAGFRKAYSVGIRGVIHKATEGAGYTDRMYSARRDAAIEAGMLWGAYHFLRPGDMRGQAMRFVDVARPDAQTLMALDHEDPKVGLVHAVNFLKAVEEILGRKAVLYSGFLIKQQLGSRPDAYLGSHRLWLAQYGSRPVVPRAWGRAWLWQYTDGRLGPDPRSIPGISTGGEPGCDINSFDGPPEVLADQWTS